MKVLIVGLGLIGGSYAKGLKKAGYEVYGVDVNKETLDYAINNNIIEYGSTNPCDYITLVDIIILGIYPAKILPFLKEYASSFLPGQIITDVCGTKSNFVYQAVELCKTAEYVSHHPMAGREKNGIKYADEKIFIGANFLITPIEGNTKSAIDTIKKIGEDLGFGRIFEIKPNHHDQMIAFTSQLTHAIAVSLVNSDHDSDTKNFIGDSYRDLTRIAMINEKLWSQLFLENKDYLIAKIEDFEVELNLLKNALYKEDSYQLEELFINSTKKRKEMEK